MKCQTMEFRQWTNGRTFIIAIHNICKTESEVCPSLECQSWALVTGIETLLTMCVSCEEKELQDVCETKKYRPCLNSLLPITLCWRLSRIKNVLSDKLM